MPELAPRPALRTPPASAARPTPRVSAAWLALLATPVAASANGPVLILPDMADSLGVPAVTATWLVTAFAWAMAVGTPIMAALLRRRGLHSVLRLCAALIVVGTAILGSSPWLPLAMVGRAAQAMGGAGLITAAMSLAGTIRRMGVITAGFGTLGAAGPLLGSAIAGVTSWRVSLAVGAVALLALPAVMRHTTAPEAEPEPKSEPEPGPKSEPGPGPGPGSNSSFDGGSYAFRVLPAAMRRHALPASQNNTYVSGRSRTGLVLPAAKRRTAPLAPQDNTPFDVRGCALLVLAATALVLVPRYPLPAVGGSLVAAVLLALHIWSRPVGFVPMSLLRTRTFVLSALLACVLASSYFMLLFTVPQLLGDRTDWSTSVIGTGQLIALLTGSALSMVLAAVSARLSRPRVLAILLAVGATAPLTAALTPWAPLLLLVATMAVFATSGGQATLAVYATQAAPAAQRPTAIGLFNLCYQLGGAFGPAIAALITLRR